MCRFLSRANVLSHPAYRLNLLISLHVDTLCAVFLLLSVHDNLLHTNGSQLKKQ